MHLQGVLRLAVVLLGALVILYVAAIAAVALLARPQHFQVQAFPGNGNGYVGVNVGADGLRGVAADGMPAGRPLPAPLVPAAGQLVFVHGTMYDPQSRSVFNPHLTTYATWSRMLSPAPAVGVGWFSAPLTLGNSVSGLRHGHLTWFGFARANAKIVAREMNRLFQAGSPTPLTAVCHSMGCAAVLDHLRQNPDARISRVLLLSASYSTKDARALANASDVTFLNVVTPDDGLARLDDATRWLVGQGGSLGGRGLREAPANWIDLRVRVTGGHCQPDTATTNDPHRLFNHVALFECANLWPEYRAFVEGRSP